MHYTDLGQLPKRADGKIIWAKSVGCIVPFVYDDITGNILILEYNNNKRTCKIYIDGYTKQRYDVAHIDTIKQCTLGRLLHKKIIDTNPELINYFVNKNDVFRYSVQSNIRVDTICPICGYIKNQIIANLYKFGFCCPQCSDGVSYPNKVMFNILKQLKVDFKNEITKKDQGFEWVGDYRYDFYFQHENKKYFIEMDGHFHHRGMNVALVKESDNIKDTMAALHNINMIRIDCNYTNVEGRFEYIKRNILKHELLSSVLNLSIINWNVVNESATNSNIYLAAQYWNDGHKTSFIAKELGVSKDSIRNYLKIATEIGLCNYSAQEANARKFHAL